VSADQDYRQRFIREADLAAKLWHPNIVRVNDRGEFNGQLWIAIDYVDGTDAASLLRDRYPVGMPADEVAMIIASTAAAVGVHACPRHLRQIPAGSQVTPGKLAA
jgi:serine/threonine-protein kinase